MALQHQYIDYNGEQFNHYYLCNYLPQHKGIDELSKSLIRFKMSSRIDVEAWTECTLLEFKKISFSPGILILRALGSEEIEISSPPRTPLDWLALKLTKQIKADYRPELLSKVRKTNGLKFLSLESRIKN